jgi:hypothetical protein
VNTIEKEDKRGKFELFIKPAAIVPNKIEMARLIQKVFLR